MCELIVEVAVRLPLSNGATSAPIRPGQYTLTENVGQEPGWFSVVNDAGEHIANIHRDEIETMNGLSFVECKPSNE